MDAIHLLVKMSTTVANAHALEGFPLFFFFFPIIVLSGTLCLNISILLSTAISNLLVCCVVKHRLMRSSSLKSQLLENNREEVKSIISCYILCSFFSSLRKRYLCYPQ